MLDLKHERGNLVVVVVDVVVEVVVEVVDEVDTVIVVLWLLAEVMLLQLFKLQQNNPDSLPFVIFPVSMQSDIQPLWYTVIPFKVEAAAVLMNTKYIIHLCIKLQIHF